MSVLYIRDKNGNLVSVPTVSTGPSEPTKEYIAAELVENQNAVTVLDDTDASIDSSDNSAYFTDDYIVVEKDTYNLDKDTMLSIPDKHLTGNGSVAWSGWDTQPQDWKDTEDATMLSSKLKVRYADDPVYLSMKLPGEANFSTDTLVRACMRASNGSGTFVSVNNMGAIMPVDYTKLPEDVVICIGNLSLYTLSRKENARWKLHDKTPVPTGQAMYYLPWHTSGDASVKIDASKITVYDDYVRFALKKSDFAPSSSVSGSLAKCLHFWCNHNELDLADNLAVITFFEVWTETPEAVGNLYTSSGCDQKSADKKTISQNFWGRNVLLRTEKTVIIGHNISDALYDGLRDTHNDPRNVYADYAASFSNPYDVEKGIFNHNVDAEAHPDIRQEMDEQIGDVKSKIKQISEVIQPMEISVPGINLNDGVYETGYIASAGTDYDGYHDQAFRSKNYIPVEGGRTIALYYDSAEWNGNNRGKPFDIVEYDSSKTLIGQRNSFPAYINNSKSYTLNTNTAYIRIAFNNWATFTTLVTDIKVAVYYIEDAVLEFVEYGFGSEAVYGVPGDKVFLTSPNGTKFVLSVSDDGTLSVTPTG